MFPAKRKKSDRERFYEAFRKQVGAEPEDYLRRKLAAGVSEQELSKRYDALALEIAMKLRCTAIRYADLQLTKTRTVQEHVERASGHQVPQCPKCGGRMVLRTGQTGARKGQKYWGCANYPACRYTKNAEEAGR